MGTTRLAIVCRSCGGTGSVGNIAMHHARLLAKDFEVLLISDSMPGVLPSGVRGLEVVPYDFRWLRRFGHVPTDAAFCLAARLAIAREHRERPIALIECHAHSVAWITGRVLQRTLGTKVVMVTHGDIYERPAGTYDSRLTAYYRFLTPRAYRTVDRVIALSPPMVDLAVNGGADRGRVRLIPNGVDPSDIGLDRDAPDLWPESSRLELLYVGRLSFEKGVDTLITAVALATGQGKDIALQIAGSGPELGRLRDMVDQFGLRERVVFVGPIPRLRLSQLYRSSHLVCVPSRSDPLPTVVIEAMWCGRAVLASDAGGLPSMVEQGTGWICPRESPEALARQLEALCTSPELTRSAGRRARERAAQVYDWGRIGMRLSAEFKSLVGSSDQRRSYGAEH